MNRVKGMGRDGLVSVNPVGLRRVVIEPSGRIVRELCPASEAWAYADSYNNPPGKSKAVVLTYPQAFQRSSSCLAMVMSSLALALT